MTKSLELFLDVSRVRSGALQEFRAQSHMRLHKQVGAVSPQGGVGRQAVTSARYGSTIALRYGDLIEEASTEGQTSTPFSGRQKRPQLQVYADDSRDPFIDAYVCMYICVYV